MSRTLSTVLATTIALAAVATTSPSAAASDEIESACDALAWQGRVAASTEVYASAADGTGRVIVSHAPSPTAHPQPTDNAGPVWAPEGSKLVWTGWDGATRNAYTANVDGSARERTVALTVDPDSDETLTPEFSPDGKRILWNDVLSSLELVTTLVDGTDRVTISGAAPEPGPASNRDWVYSPDGGQVAWRGWTGNSGESQIYVANTDGSDRHTVSDVGPGPHPTSNTAPSWSPDGSRLTYHGYDGAVLQIYVVDDDGSDRHVISDVSPGTDPTNNSAPQWSPDGAHIAWTGSLNNLSQIFVANADGTLRRIVSTDNSNFDPRWSPDGTRLAWRQFGINVAAIDGSPPIRIDDVADGTDPTSNRAPRWRPRSGDIDLASTLSDTAGIDGDATVTISATTECPHSMVEIVGLDVACLLDPEVSVSAGTVSNSVWTIDVLDGTETATITGRLNGTHCGGTASVDSSTPDDPTPSTTRFGFTPASVDCETPEAPFTDVSTSSFARKDITCIYNLDITTGTSATTYDPAGNVTREQMAAFLARTWRALGNSCLATTPGFDDVAASSFAAEDIACIRQLGITTGTSPTTYDPAGNVTREQMAAFLGRLWRAVGKTCPTTPHGFADVPSTSFSETDIGCIKALGITTGTSPTTYDPAGNVTREQMAAFLGRLWRAATD